MKRWRGIWSSAQRRTDKVKRMATRLTPTADQNPAPTSRPSAAVTHTVAAVVRPRTVSPCLKMTPPPRKPMPVMTPWATL